eukprot:TRINITY_DN15485_c0_g1_i1.p1 TRINITY_DN15485_c0_g1~~TRINITY_DN15485_c0_g1_i1.p1  ORF type:complete len:697 (+),score=119.12 TRINITY_DN15485_c0_g1_i1:37-2091(+)
MALLGTTASRTQNQRCQLTRLRRRAATEDMCEVAKENNVSSAPCNIAEVFRGLTLKDVICSENSACRFRPQNKLGQLADALVSSGQTAMAVADSGGKLHGIVTVNDVMRAYFEDASPDERLDEWLDSGRARAPRELLQLLRMRPETPLAKVAEKMVINATAGDCACHHILAEDESGGLHVISTHDLMGLFGRYRRPPSANKENDTIGRMTVADVMNPRGSVFTCSSSQTIKDALRVLLVTQQNSILITDEEGVCGLITPRHMVKAFMDSLPSTVTLASFIGKQRANLDTRMMLSDINVVEAAGAMTVQGVDHFMVVRPGSREVMGVLSSFDVLLRMSKHATVFRSMPDWVGPTVGLVLRQNKHLEQVLPRGASLFDAAKALTSSCCTNVTVLLGSMDPHLGLLSEMSLVRAYVDGWSADSTAEEWLNSTHDVFPQHLQVPHSMPLTQAASMMLRAAEHGRVCQHLEVRAASGARLGYFSALDVARALVELPSELDIARTGADRTEVEMVMTSIKRVPKCKPSDSIGNALGLLITSGQTAALVEDEDGYMHGLITSRCGPATIAAGVPRSCSVAEWLRQRSVTSQEPRKVALGSRLLDAAVTMTTYSFHHLLVMDYTQGDDAARPVGVLSSLDIVRGVASIRSRCPFVTLGWLRRFGPTNCFGDDESGEVGRALEIGLGVAEGGA